MKMNGQEAAFDFESKVREKEREGEREREDDLIQVDPFTKNRPFSFSLYL